MITRSNKGTVVRQTLLVLQFNRFQSLASAIFPFSYSPSPLFLLVQKQQPVAAPKGSKLEIDLDVATRPVC